MTTVYTDTGRTAPASPGDTVAGLTDLSGNEHHATQATAAQRPIFQTSPDRLVMDKVDDRMLITVPVGGWTGTMVLGTDQGTASYGVTLPEGSYEIGGKGGLYFPGTHLIGCLLRDGALSSGEAAAVESRFVSRGAQASYGAVTSFIRYWRDRSEITEFPLIDTISGTSFNSAWRGCSGLTSFPLIDTSSGTNFAYAWLDCSSLTSFPANLFNNVKGGDFTNAFLNTALTQTSIDNILVSLVASGVSTGTRVFNQSGGSAPSATGEAAIDTLRLRGWTVTVTGGY